MRFLLTMAYDGRPYAGWQSQTNGTSVQDAVETAMAKIAKISRTEAEGNPLRLHAAGRTDAGVHALGQTAHFQAPAGSRMTAPAWLAALNAHLPPSIRITDCQPVAENFHARFDASGKTYRYRVVTSPILLPLDHGRACHHPLPLHLDRLHTAAQSCVGRHNFTAFAATRGDPRENDPGYAVRELWEISLNPAPDGSEFTLTFYGEGFLYKMVRLLTGAFLRVGRGRESQAWLEDFLHRPAGRRTSYVAPAEGLTLVKVHYSTQTASCVP